MFRSIARMSLWLVATAGLAAAETTPPPARPDSGSLGRTQAAAEADYHKKVVCKYEKVIGTRIQKRVCRTAADAAVERESSKEFLKDIQHNGALETRPPPG